MYMRELNKKSPAKLEYKSTRRCTRRVGRRGKKLVISENFYSKIGISTTNVIQIPN